MIESPSEPATHRRPPILFEARAVLELAQMLAPLAGAHLRRPPARSASPIIVAPGFGSGDAFSAPLRRYLGRLGYRAEGWGLGRNLAGIDIAHDRDDLPAGWLLPPAAEYRGEGSVPLLVGRFAERVLARHRQLGRSITLIGWSLGGFVAREVARDLPEAVDRLITLGAPVVGGPKYTAAVGFFRKRGANVDWIECAIERREERPIRQPITAIYSKSDAIVSWPAAIDRFSPRVRHVEVNGTHLGMGFNPTVWAHVVAALESDPG